MRKFALLLFLALATNFLGYAQQNTAFVSFKNKLNADFKNPEKSPLSREEIKTFTELPFFDYDPKFKISADFVRTPYEVPFEMPTTTARKPIYIKYGEVYFNFNGKDYVLNLYQNQQLSTEEAYKNYLFLPFTDRTNGDTSYSGGRYLDLEIPASDTIIIDFNKAYNPYCAYNGEYSCPIPPVTNSLDIWVEAGVRHEN